jgi:hypothetical protein
MSDKETQEVPKEFIKEKTEFPTELVTLPSKGYFYPADNSLSTGQIELKYPTAAEEDILTSRNLIQKRVVIDKFLQSIIVSPVDYNELLMGDKNGIMVASRILAYGKDYPFEVDCPSCGQKNHKEADLSKLEAKDVEFKNYPEGINEFDFELPVSKKNVRFKLLTHSDLRQIEEELAGLRKVLKSSTEPASKEITTRLKHAIISVAGDTSKQNINSFVDTLLSQDSLALRREISKVTPDINLTYDFNCDYCGFSNEIDLPMGVSFFWPSGRL